MTSWYDDAVASALAVAVDHGCAALHPFVNTVDADLVAAAHGLGLAVNTWTCDDPRRIVELAAMGVDGIVTNVPDMAVAALAGREAAGSSGGQDEA